MGIGANIQIGPNPEVTVAGRNFLKAVHTADVKAIMLDSTAVDAGNTPTTTLRAGLFWACATKHPCSSSTTMTARTTAAE